MLFSDWQEKNIYFQNLSICPRCIKIFQLALNFSSTSLQIFIWLTSNKNHFDLYWIWNLKIYFSWKSYSWKNPGTFGNVWKTFETFGPLWDLYIIGKILFCRVPKGTWNCYLVWDCSLLRTVIRYNVETYIKTDFLVVVSKQMGQKVIFSYIFSNHFP